MKKKFEKKYDQKLYLQDVFSDFSFTINIDINHFLFLYKGKRILSNNMKKISELNDNKIKIFVYNLKIRQNKKKEELNDIICPECNSLAIINNNNDRISLNCFVNNHIFSDLKINWFNDSQYIDESSINCYICGNNKRYYNKFYICSIAKFICPLCLNDNTKHKDLEYRFQKCLNHNLDYLSYCYSCHLNLCEKCEEEKHLNHEIKSFKQRTPNEKRIKEIKEESEKINKYKEGLELLKEGFNNFINDLIYGLKMYNRIYEILIKNSKELRNYESIKNISDFRCKELISEIDNFFSNENSKLLKIINLYENKKNEMNLIYKINEEGNVRLFGKTFVDNNKNNCYILYKNKINRKQKNY